MLDEGEMQYTKPEQEKGEKTPTTHLPKALSLKKKKEGGAKKDGGKGLKKIGRAHV